MNIGRQGYGDNKIILPQEIYHSSLKIINGVPFTQREIDIVAYICTGRSAKKIASRLSLSPKTIENHIRNIKIKLGCSSQEGIIDFIEKSDKFTLVKQYYASLVIQHHFKKALDAIAITCNSIEPLSCYFFHDEENQDITTLLNKLKNHLSYFGIRTLMGAKEGVFSSDFTIFIEGSSLGISKPLNKVTYLSLTSEGNYYFLFFKVLKALLPNINIDKILSEFFSHYNQLYDTPFLKTQDIIKQGGIQEGKETVSFKILIKNKLKGLFFIVMIFTTLVVGYQEIGKTQVSRQHAKQHSTFAQNGRKTDMGLLLNLPIRNSKFVGRKKELKAINEFLNKYKFGVITQTISGLGGVGKTQLAASYAYSSIEEKLYDTILWIRAETSDSLNNSYIEFSKSLNMDIHGFQPSDVQRLIHAELKNFNTKDILFVLDNAMPSKHIEDYLSNLSKDFSNLSKLHVLITSRSQKWHQDKLLLDNFTKQEAHTFIKQHLPNEKDSSIDNLATILHYFPLAINQAIMYIQAHTNIDTYLELLNQNNNYKKNLNNYTNALWSTWNLSFSNLSANAKSILIMSSYLDADEINLNYFKNLTLEERDSAIAELKNYSFVTMNNNENSFKIHRLLQKIVREHEGSKVDLMKIIKMLDFSFAVYQHVNKDSCDALMPHIISLAHHAIEMPDLFHEGLALYIKATMYSTYIQEDIKLSHERWSEISNLSKNHLSTEEGFHYLLANINTHIGFNNYLLGNLIAAEQTLNQAKDVYEKPMTQISTKIETLLKSLRWANQTSIKDNILSDYAFALNAITSIEFYLNKTYSVEENCKKVLHVVNQCKEQNKINVYKIVYLNNVLRFYIYIKNLEKANLIASELRQLTDEDTSGLSQSYTNEGIGELRLFQGDYEGAIKLFEQALQAKSKIYAKNNHRIGKTLCRIGTVLIRMNRPKAALEYLKEAEKIYDNHIAKHNIKNLCLYFLIHCALEANQDYKNSTQYLKQLYDMILLSNNQNAHILISQQVLIIENFNRLKSSTKDIAYIQQSLELINKIFGKDSLYASKYHYLLGIVFQNSLQKEKAFRHFNTALSIILGCNVTDSSLKTQNDSNISLIKEKLNSLKTLK